MKKKEPTRNLYIDLSKRIIELKIKLLAHHSDDKDFGAEELSRVKSEYEPLIAKLTDKDKRERCYDELNSFTSWCINYRTKIINKYYSEGNSDDK